MYMSNEKFEEIKYRHSPTITTDDDVGAAFEFVRELFEAEADALREKCTYPTSSIRDMENVAYRISSMASEIEKGQFGEER